MVLLFHRSSHYKTEQRAEPSRNRSDVIVLEDTSRDEIAQLTHHYNSMAMRIQSQSAQIKQLEHRRRLLLSDLSHDLRTPLTMILGYAELIRTGAYKNENELQSGAKIILQRSRYMDKLLDQLLDITRQEEHLLRLQLAPHNLSELMRKIAAEYLLFLDDKNIVLEADIQDTDIEVMIDAPLIERALRNLLDNAVRYGEEGHYLGIGLTEEQEEVVLTVKTGVKGSHERIASVSSSVSTAPTVEEKARDLASGSRSSRKSRNCTMAACVCWTKL